MGNRTGLRALAFGLGVVICACGGSALENPPPVAKQSPPLPTIVTVDVLSAMIGPSKADGRAWDGLPGARIPDAARAAVRAALGATNPYAAVGLVLAELVNTGTKPPDVQGTATMFFGGQPTGPAQFLPKIQDSFTPSWLTPARWSHVPLDDRVRIRVHFDDADLQFDDPIGDVELNAGHLATALAAGTVSHIRVENQTQEQVLFVGISVMREQ